MEVELDVETKIVEVWKEVEEEEHDFDQAKLQKKKRRKDLEEGGDVLDDLKLVSFERLETVLELDSPSSLWRLI